MVSLGGLDLPRGQPPLEHLDGEPLDLRCPAREAGAHARHEDLGTIGHLRHAVLDQPFGTFQPAPVTAVPVARALRGAVLVEELGTHFETRLMLIPVDSERHYCFPKSWNRF